MQRRTRRNLVGTLLALLVLAVAWACGGSGGPNPIGVRDVSDAIARATTLAEMERAFGRLFDLVGIAAGGQSRDVLMRFAQPQLDSGGVDHASFQASYEALLERLGSDPRTADYVLDLDAAAFLALVNSRLAGAYANPNAPENAIYVLLSSRPGHVPYVAPQMTLDEGVTVVQVMMMLIVYGNVWAERNGDSIVPATVQMARQGEPRRAVGPCQDACQNAFVGCDQSCGDTFRVAMRQTLEHFWQQIRPVLINVVVIVSGAATIYSMLYQNCRGDVACQQNLINAKNATIEAARGHWEETYHQASLGYADEVDRNRDAFDACRTGCNQALAVCLEGCHNQGGG